MIRTIRTERSNNSLKNSTKHMQLYWADLLEHAVAMLRPTRGYSESYEKCRTHCGKSWHIAYRDTQMEEIKKNSTPHSKWHTVPPIKLPPLCKVLTD